ncbi:hypothetical protein ACEE01_01635 [Staphylococcus simulans]
MLNTYESLSLVQPPIEVINTISEGSNAEIIELLEPVDFDSIINKIKQELYIIIEPQFNLALRQIGLMSPNIEIKQL